MQCIKKEKKYTKGLKTCLRLEPFLSLGATSMRPAFTLVRGHTRTPLNEAGEVYAWMVQGSRQMKSNNWLGLNFNSQSTRSHDESDDFGL